MSLLNLAHVHLWFSSSGRACVNFAFDAFKFVRCGVIIPNSLLQACSTGNAERQKYFGRPCLYELQNFWDVLTRFVFGFWQCIVTRQTMCWQLMTMHWQNFSMKKNTMLRIVSKKVVWMDPPLFWRLNTMAGVACWLGISKMIFWHMSSSSFLLETCFLGFSTLNLVYPDPSSFLLMKKFIPP